MYKVKKSMEISGAHHLRLDYESKCTGLHGHNWKVTVYMQSQELDENGMVEDFTRIKERVHSRLDHKCLNDVLEFNPTAENIARWICEELGEKCYKVKVKESGGNKAVYERDSK